MSSDDEAKTRGLVDFLRDFLADDPDALWEGMRLMRENMLTMWTVYDHPSDCPDAFVAREWAVNKDGQIPGCAIRSDDLEVIRDSLRKLGLVPLARNDGDDPCIIETWI